MADEVPDYMQGAVPVAPEPAAQQPAASGNMPAYMAGAQPLDSLEAEQHVMAQQEAAYQGAQAKYGGIGQQAITGLEGAAEGATLGLSTLAERAMGVKAEDIEGRRAANPATHTLGQVGGLGASTYLSLGAAPIMEAGGLAAVKAAGLAGGETALSKIGASATQMAVENALFQSGDELSKMASSQDPRAGAESALLNIGLAGALGGVLGGAAGSVSPLWKATMGDKMETWLQAIKQRVNGESVPLSPEMKQALGELGGDLSLPPEVRAAGMSPELEKQFNILQESKTTPGLKLKESIENFRGEASTAIAKALGKEPEELMAKGEISHFDAGSKLQDSLGEKVKNLFEPLENQWDAVTKKFENIPISAEANTISDKLASLADLQGWSRAPSSEEFKLLNETLGELPLQKTLKDLAKYQSIIKSKAHRAEIWFAGKEINKILDEVLESSYHAAASGEGTDFLTKFSNAKAGWREAKNIIEQLDDRLHVGSFSGPKTFLYSLKNNLNPEEVARRLSKPNDVGLMTLLKEQFPEIASQVKEYNLNKLVGPAVTKAEAGHALNSRVFFNALDNLTPEMRGFVLPAGAETKLNAIKTLMDSVPKYKTSNTAGNLDALWSKIPGSATGLAAMLTGHNPVVGFLLGTGAKWASRDAPDAVRLSMLKFLGSEGHIDSAGFKAMVDFIHDMQKGNTLLTKSIKGLIHSGENILPSKLIPDDNDRKRLEKNVDEIKANPQKMENIGGDMISYLPDHGQHFAQVTSRAVHMLDMMKPTPTKGLPFDKEQEPDKMQTEQYKRAQNIALQPLVVMNSIKDGTVSLRDVGLFKMFYPSLYESASMKLTNEVAQHLANEGTVPYQTRIGIAKFLGQPLDATMKPGGIMSLQQSMFDASQQGPTQGQVVGNRMQALKKQGNMMQTQQQASEARKTALS